MGKLSQALYLLLFHKKTLGQVVTIVLKFINYNLSCPTKICTKRSSLPQAPI